MIKYNPSYFMDHVQEARRLAEKVDARTWVPAYLAEHLPQGGQVLDVGCGPGVIAAEVARRDIKTVVVGCDASVDRIAEANLNLRDFPLASGVHGDALQLPFAADRYDLVYSRFLLEYLGERERAVAEMVRVTRPGGRVLIQDLDGQLIWHYPVDATLQAGLERVLAFLQSTGFDPFVGRKLFHLAHAAGLKNLQVRAEPYHLIAGRADQHTMDLWTMKLDIAEAATTHALGSLEAALELKRRFLDYLQRDDTMTYSTVFTVSGVKN